MSWVSKMLISPNFQKFIFGCVLPELKKEGVVLEFQEPKFKFRTSSVHSESIRNLLKYLDLKYPRDEKGEPISYTKLDSKQMNNHILWIEHIALNSGLEMGYIASEWDRILYDCGIIKT